MKAAWYERKGAAEDVLAVGETAPPSPAAGDEIAAAHALVEAGAPGKVVLEL